MAQAIDHLPNVSLRPVTTRPGSNFRAHVHRHQRLCQGSEVTHLAQRSAAQGEQFGISLLFARLLKEHLHPVYSVGESFDDLLDLAGVEFRWRRRVGGCSPQRQDGHEDEQGEPSQIHSFLEILLCFARRESR